MALIRRASVLIKPAHLVSESTHDADNRFLECAEAAGADFLVTGNRRFFLFGERPQVLAHTRL
jgi:predicted nucleic acid-binding protein